MSEAPRAPASFPEELARARLTYKRVLQTISKAFRAVRLGQTFSYAEIDQGATAIVESLGRNPDALVSLSLVKGNDKYLIEHSANVAILGAALALAMGYESDTLLEIAFGGLLHDIGMGWVPEKIFSNFGNISEAEFSIVKRHPEYGIEIAKSHATMPDRVKKIIGQHHERLSGRGYPHGLAGNRIDYFALITGAADVYDALTTDRPYGKALTPPQALSTIYSGMEKEFPKAISEHFVKVTGVYPVGTFVVLGSGEKGIVTKINRDGFLIPDIVVLFSADGKRLAQPVEVSLAERTLQENGGRFKISRVLNPQADGVTVADILKAAAA
jgi:putative nucleotidyltransferase with HDIG domain